MLMPDEDFAPSDSLSYEAYEDSLEVKCGKAILSPIGDNKENTSTPIIEAIPVQEKVSREAIKTEEKESVDFLNGIKNFLGSNEFEKQIRSTAKKTKIPPKVIRKNFLKRIAGSIADTMNIGINMVEVGVNTVLNLINSVLQGGVALICSVAKAIVRTMTLNNSNRVTN